MAALSVTAIETSVQGTPQILGIEYDLWSLRVRLAFPGTDAPTYAVFGSLHGFRVLREGDLLSFWPTASSVSTWLWLVQRGGWLSQETSFGNCSTISELQVFEYLIAGEVECLSVFAAHPPSIVRVEV